MKNYVHVFTMIIIALIVCQIISFAANAEAEDYRAWTQYDSRWGNMKMGTSTLAAKGCLVSSIAKLIIQAGLRNQSNFNIGTLNAWLNNNGGFSGASLYWGKPAEYIDGFNFYGFLLGSGSHSSISYNDEIVEWAKQGYHMAICVRNGGHWVAVDEPRTVSSGTVYIMDSGYSGGGLSDVILSSKYSTFSSIGAYTGGKIYESEEQPAFDNPPIINDTLPANLGEELYAYIRSQSENIYLTNQQSNIGGEAFTGENTQIWRFNRQSNGAYSISSVYDNACMDVLGLSTEDGANVYAYTGGYLGNTNQEFYIYRMYDAYYFSPVHTNGTHVLDMNLNSHNLEMWGVGTDWAPQEFDICAVNKINDTLPVNLGEEFYAYIRNQSENVYLTNQQNNISGEAFTGENTQIWRFNRQSNGSYAISSVFDNACMDVLGVSTEDGANVYAYTDGFLGNANQEFYVYRMYDAYYFSPVHTNGTHVLDMNLNSHNLEMWGVGADWAPQEFDICKINKINDTLPVNLGEEFFAYIRNQAGNVYLTNQQSNIGGEAFTGENTQIWRFNRQNNGSYAISSIFDNACMDVLGLSTEDGANVYAYTGGFLGNANQEFYIYWMYDAFYFSPVHTNGTHALDMNLSSNNLEMWGVGVDWAPQEFDICRINKINDTLPVNLGEEFFAYIRNQAGNVYLTNQQSNIGGEAFTGENTQIWRFNRQSNGSYAISSVFDNACMDVFGLSTEDGANVYAYTGGFLGNANQEFYVYRMYDAYYFSPVHTNGTHVLDMNLSSNNLEMWGVGVDWAPQEFDIAEVVFGRSEFALPASLRIIEEDAFANLGASEVRCNDTLKEIRALAFEDCISLTRIYIPESVTSISDTAFEGCQSSLTIYGKKNSEAQSFAQRKGFRFIVVAD